MIKRFLWNPWHGCIKLSDGCKNCYVYSMDAKYDRDSRIITKNKTFNLPISKNRKGEYKIPQRSIINTCFTSDFFLPEADKFRSDAWDIIKKRSDVMFFFITKRIENFYDCIPSDWGEGYKNVEICCTVENQKMADYRLPILLKAPIAIKSITCSPLLTNMNIEKYLTDDIRIVVVGGESGQNARASNFDWVMNIRQQCINKNVSFKYHQTGAKLFKDNKLFYINRKYQHTQAFKAGIDKFFEKEDARWKI